MVHVRSDGCHCFKEEDSRLRTATGWWEKVFRHSDERRLESNQRRTQTGRRSVPISVCRLTCTLTKEVWQDGDKSSERRRSRGETRCACYTTVRDLAETRARRKTNGRRRHDPLGPVIKLDASSLSPFNRRRGRRDFKNLDDKTPKTTSLTWNTNEQYKFYVIIRVSLYVFNDHVNYSCTSGTTHCAPIHRLMMSSDDISLWIDSVQSFPNMGSHGRFNNLYLL